MKYVQLRSAFELAEFHEFLDMPYLASGVYDDSGTPVICIIASSTPCDATVNDIVVVELSDSKHGVLKASGGAL